MSEYDVKMKSPRAPVSYQTPYLIDRAYPWSKITLSFQRYTGFLSE